MAARLIGTDDTDPWLPASVKVPAGMTKLVDSGNHYTATDVEGVLAEIAPQLGGGGGGAVASVNGKTGTVVLNSTDVGAVSSVNGKTGTSVSLTSTDVGAVASSGAGNAPQPLRMAAYTAAGFAALVTKDPNTFYVIVP
jgi:hypothetical protein